ncbi:MAG: hypothetical protein P8Y95_08550 [Gammaproteobacteria bacterium]|jgi:plastocyanin
MITSRVWSRQACLLALAFALPVDVLGATIEATVRSDGDRPVEDAVVYAMPIDREALPDVHATGVIDQIDKEYVPHVTAVAAGTAISFPNSDPLRHHVYSFSPAKTFEIPLYRGTPPEPIVFDTPGEVVLGCNIHDWMKAYVLVLETPHYAVTGTDGRAVLTGLPEGRYAVEVWHPRLDGEPSSTREEIGLSSDGVSRVSFDIVQRRVWRPRRSPSTTGIGY